MASLVEFYTGKVLFGGAKYLGGEMFRLKVVIFRQDEA